MISRVKRCLEREWEKVWPLIYRGLASRWIGMVATTPGQDGVGRWRKVTANRAGMLDVMITQRKKWDLQTVSCGRQSLSGN